MEQKGHAKKSITIRSALTAIACIVFVALVAAVLRTGTTKASNAEATQKNVPATVSQTAATNPYAVLQPASVPSKTP
jgi:hypothetical protein